jgi:hypothetical protein
MQLIETFVLYNFFCHLNRSITYVIPRFCATGVVLTYEKEDSSIALFYTLCNGSMQVDTAIKLHIRHQAVDMNKKLQDADKQDEVKPAYLCARLRWRGEELAGCSTAWPTTWTGWEE